LPDEPEIVDNQNALKPKKRLILPWIGAIGGVLGAVVLAWWVGYQVGKDVSTGEISRLQGKLNDCEKERHASRIRLDALDALEKPDTSLLCPTDADYFLNGQIVVQLQSITSYHNEQPRAKFFIEYPGTPWADTFSTSGDFRVYEFSYGGSSYGLYFLGYETRETETCARIMVKKLRGFE
jgi:hypothetical protein